MQGFLSELEDQVGELIENNNYIFIFAHPIYLMKKQKNIVLYLLLFFAISYFSCLKDKAKLPVVPVGPSICDTMRVSFSKDVQPIISSSCATSSGCHANGTVNSNFSDYNGVKGKAPDGFNSIRDRVIDKKNMPPGGALSDSQIQIIDCWLKKGYPNN